MSSTVGAYWRITGIPLLVQRITEVYLPMLRHPNIGYGKNMNPCMDCHALMFRLAGERMQAEGFDFLFSGEVLGQRPMSQSKTSLRYVEKHSGFEGYIVRPLSARRLPETIPEADGRVDRERLLDLSGRSRKPQIHRKEKRKTRSLDAPDDARSNASSDELPRSRVTMIAPMSSRCLEPYRCS